VENMEMNILVTGATGFIGTNLIPKLLERGYKVIALKRSSSDISRFKFYGSANKNIVFYNFDDGRLDRIFEKEKIDVVVHLATYYKKKHLKDDIKSMIQANTEFPTEILEMMIEHGVKYFINTGTFFEYALDSNKPIAEDHQVNPYDLYASTKIALENILKFYTEKFSISASTLRLFAPYGPFDHENKIIPFMIKNILGKTNIEFNSDGFQRWDYIFVDDIAEAFIKAIDFTINSHIKHEIFNIGTGKTVSIREIFEILKTISKTNIRATWGKNTSEEIKYACADTTKARTLLKWERYFDIRKGLEVTYDWFRSNQNSWRIN